MSVSKCNATQPRRNRVSETVPIKSVKSLRVLALEAYYGGSHKAFLDDWMASSCHAWTLFTLPSTKWKWRMRHAAVTFATDVAAAVKAGGGWDLVVTSDMLALADFKGLAPAGVRNLPAVAYFHENQITYPVREASERDYHFVFSNLTTALAAEEVWFNSAFHRDEFLAAATAFLKRMPDHQPLDAIERIRVKSRVHPPSVVSPERVSERADGPLHILWAARWEFDKCPERFFKAIDLLAAQGVDFRLSVIGGEPGRRPLDVFDAARRRFADRIQQWGFLSDRADYEAALASADVVVSTADHEFFGISVIEAAAFGAFPLVPRRLAYPEVFAGTDSQACDSFFYEGDEHVLCGRLAILAARKQRGTLWQGNPARARSVAARYAPSSLIPARDAALSAIYTRR